ncbi:MAG TPA: leucyl/phenylalanyl-tRNA--protein transferase [Thermoanaerobaculia bacterium]|nr:leucyl/phenylalanyl-tRNA--protein transferase [Thermoanaerobaculia bacterium]
MSESRFPDPRRAPGDIVAVGNDLRLQTLIDAYRHGIFPWPHEGVPLPWFSPRRRTVLFFAELHLSRSLRRAAARSTWTFTIDRDFRSVIRSCAKVPRTGQDSTWIQPEMITAYTALHDAGHAHSVEAWEEDELVGGVYGVDAGGVFTGESMFHLRPNASKLALLFLIGHLERAGSTWLDCQTMTPHMDALGAREIGRAKFLDLLATAQQSGVKLF